jgi:hypothetical protein
MKILEKLKTIGINIPKLKDIVITGIKFSSLISIDRSVRIEGSTVIIDPEGLSGKQKRGLKQIIKVEALEEAGAIVEETNAPTVNAALEALPSIQEASKKFLPIIPPKDIPLLNACLFLRLRFERGESVEELKGQIVRVYGTRGGNFANLCSAGYLEQWFGPIYDKLVLAYPDDPAMVKAKFQALYNTIVSELPWTEFVSRSSAARAIAHICEKMQRNIQNGVRYLNIHALGEKNVKTVLSILPEIQSKTKAVPVRIDQDKERIFVRLEIAEK